jgi:two-component system sensor histidine kinase RpfC
VLVDNGRQALDTLEQNEFDLIIMDMQMPEMGGIEAAKLYRFSTTASNRTPIIILTANATLEAKRECEEANIDAYLTKPIVSDILIENINLLCCHIDHKRKNILAKTCNSTTAHTADSKLFIDKNVIQSIKDLSEDTHFVQEVIDTFINDTTRLLSEMESSIANKNYTLYMEHMHALKGSAGSVGAKMLFEHCRGTLLRAPRDVNYISNLKETRQLFRTTESELHNYLSISAAKPVESTL